MPRGIIIAPSRFQQKCSFDGMVFGTISPTDIDAFIDFNDRLFVFIEAKSGDAQLGRGQRLALERLCRPVKGRHAVALVARHDAPPDEHIVLAECCVEIIYSSCQWRMVSERITVIDQIGVLLDEHGLGSASTHRLPNARTCKHKPEFIKDGRCWICDHA